MLKLIQKQCFHMCLNNSSEECAVAPRDDRPNLNLDNEARPVVSSNRFQNSQFRQRVYTMFATVGYVSRGLAFKRYMLSEVFIFESCF